MTKVFILWHVHSHPSGDDDEKLIGVYSSQISATAAIDRVKDQLGFIDHPDGFSVHEYELDRDHWTEGFVSAG
jgi:homoserine kinase type II